MSNQLDQLGFDALLETAARDNTAHAFEKETRHFPSDWAEAIAYHRRQIECHHKAMLATDFDAAMAIRNDAYLLARKLNRGAAGILAGDDAPGSVLARETAVQEGRVPLWGQYGVFAVQAAGMALNVEMSGMFGFGAMAMPYLGFSVRAVDCTKPFLSETGFRSFLDVSVDPRIGMTPADFVCRSVELHVANELNGTLLGVAMQYRERQS
ncbi:hypothetical protein [Maritalea sp.]|uniref:hypothetical protein n=1 Tax=Maritalea sp. TaxID=2003361 RepID=UPI003EF443F9